tara:strand:+ start:682 stop:1353 length:672 start_codon:yes stop_codon:yes gene_type:complete
MINSLLRKYHQWKLATSQQNEVLKDGTLLNAFYNSKTMFIHIPKTAGVSLIKAIYGNVTFSGHRSFYFNNIALNIQDEKYFSFAFVRNPFDRLYSAYMFLQKGGINHDDKLAFSSHMLKFQDFEDFVLNGLDEKLIYKVIHLIPQYDYLCDRKGNILVDFVGRFENLEYDIIMLSDRLNKKIELSHYNYNKKKNYVEVYTEPMIEKVYKIYQKDIDIFEYSFK